LAQNTWLRRAMLVTGAVAVSGWAAYRAAERALRPAQPQLALARGHRLLYRSHRVLVAVGRWEDMELLIGGTLRMLARIGSEITIAGPGPVPVNPTWRELAVPHPLLPEAIPTENAYSPPVQKALKRLWANLEPDVVLTFDPVFPVRVLYHPAHGLVGHAALDLALADQVPPADVFTFATRRPNVLVDIGPVVNAKTTAAARAAAEAALGVRGRVAARVAARAAGFLGRLYGRAAGVNYAEGLRAVTPSGPASQDTRAQAAFDGAGRVRETYQV